MHNRSLGTLLVVAMAFATFGSVLAGIVTCTPATCIGPVYASFVSSNCSGTPTFSPINVPYGVCSEGELYEKNEHGFAMYSFDDFSCDLSASNASYDLEFYRWGACVPRFSISARKNGMQFAAVSNSYMFLENVNATVTPHNFDNQPIQAFQENFQTCFSPDNCTLENGQTALSWTTYYPSAATCENPDYSYMDLSVNFGVCTNYYNQTYAKIGCFESKGTYKAYYKDSACTDVISVNGRRSSCATTRQDLHCNAPITPLPFGTPEPAPSAASSSQISSLLMLAATLILLAV